MWKEFNNLIQVAEWKFDQLDTDRDGVLKKKELKVIEADSLEN